MVVTVVVLFSYKYMKKQTVVNNQIYHAIPVNTAFFIESNNFSGFLKSLRTNSYWLDLTNVSNFRDMDKQVAFLEKLINTNTNLENLLSEQPVIISTHLNGKNSFDYLFLIGLSGIFDESQAVELIKTQLEGKASFIERNYSNQIVYDVKVNENQEPGNFSFSVCENIFIMSFSSILVEDAIRQIQAPVSLDRMSDFNKVSATSGKNVLANIFINYKTFSRFFSQFLEKPFSNYSAEMNNLACWTELDISLKDDQILLNGFTYVTDSVVNYLNLFMKQEPVKIKAEKVLPANTSSFISIGISNYKEYHNERIKYLQDIDKFEKLHSQLNNVKSDLGIELTGFFENIFEEEATIAYGDISTDEIDQNAYVIIKTKSKSLAEEEMIKILVAYSEKRNINIETLSSVCKIDNETSFPVYKMPLSNFSEMVLGDIFGAFETHYFSFYDNYLILSKTESGLKSIIHANILQKNLESEISFNAMKDNLSNKSNVFIYSNTTASKDIYKKYLSPELKKSLDSNINYLGKFQTMAYQLFPSKNMIYNNLILQYNPVVKEKTRTLWDSKLDTTMSFKPRILVNHITNEKEIFVQDDNNSIYLFSDAGRILWKIKIDSRIMSEVYQVDCFKNDKLQLLFNTKDKLYIIDRLGNNLTNFPVEFRAEATNGIGLFDYENSGDYRIFVACRDKKIYAYDLEGKIIKGWEFDKTDQYVYSPIQHFRIKETDYLIFSDSLKTYILDRKGNQKVKPESYINLSRNNMFYLGKNPSEEEYSFITSDVKGKVVRVHLNGKIETIDLGNYSKDHFFEYSDFDGDGQNDYIITDKTNIAVFNIRKTQLFTLSMPEDIYQKPYLYIFPDNNRKIGFCLKNRNEIYLYSSDNKMHEGFPLKGNTSFSIGNIDNSNGNFNLFVGGPDGFLYNYAVR